MEPDTSSQPSYPVQFDVDYPDRELNRLEHGLPDLRGDPDPDRAPRRSAASAMTSWGGHTTNARASTAGLLVLPAVLMIVFRQKYPRWWFDWNLELMRFLNRIGVYLSLLDDRYPSTDERQSVMFDMPYPDAKNGLNRWLPLVKWILAIPHYIVLVFLGIAAFFVVVFAWFAIIFTGRYPRGAFDFVVGSPAGTTASSGTRSPSSPTSTHRSASAHSFRIPTALRAIIEASYGPAGDGPSRTPSSPEAGLATNTLLTIVDASASGGEARAPARLCGMLVEFPEQPRIGPLAAGLARLVRRAPRPSDRGLVVALIPAQDEQDRIGKAIRSLNEQSSNPDLTIVIADDCTDRTALAAQSAGADVFVTVGNEHKRAGGLESGPRPPPPTAPRR